MAKKNLYKSRNPSSSFEDILNTIHQAYEYSLTAKKPHYNSDILLAIYTLLETLTEPEFVSNAEKWRFSAQKAVIFEAAVHLITDAREAVLKEARKIK
jgi:hypothetical protein